MYKTTFAALRKIADAGPIDDISALRAAELSHNGVAPIEAETLGPAAAPVKSKSYNKKDWQLQDRLQEMFGPTARVLPSFIGGFTLEPVEGYTDAHRAAWFYNQGKRPTQQQIYLSDKVIKARDEARKRYKDNPNAPYEVRSWVTPAGVIHTTDGLGLATRANTKVGAFLNALGINKLNPHYWESERGAFVSGPFGVVSPGDAMSTLAHEGVIPSDRGTDPGVSGHMGNRDINIHTVGPGMYRSSGKLKGLPYYAINNSALAADTGSYASFITELGPDFKTTSIPMSEARRIAAVELGKTDWSKRLNLPKLGPVAQQLLTSGNTLHGYFNAVPEFKTLASNIKFMGANKGIDVSKFDVQHPDVLIDKLERLKKQYDPLSGKDENLISPYNSDLPIDELLNMVRRYQSLLENNHRSPAEEAEFEHMRRALPAAFDTASLNTNKASGVV